MCNACIYWNYWDKSEISWSKQCGFTVECFCSVGLQLPRIHGSMRVAINYLATKTTKPTFLFLFFNLVHIFLGISRACLDNILHSPDTLFLCQSLCAKGLMDKDWTLISTIKEYIAQGAESRLCKNCLVVICELQIYPSLSV